MRNFIKLCLLSILFISQVAMAKNCGDFGGACRSYCKTSICKDACSRGQSHCKASGCGKANAQCEAQCAELDSWDAQENCYNACWKGAKQC